MGFLKSLRSRLTSPETPAGMLLTFARNVDPSAWIRLQSPQVVVVNRHIYRVVKADESALALLPVTFGADALDPPRLGGHPITIAWEAIRTLHIP